MTFVMYKWTVPVDDRPHEIGGGKIIHARARTPNEVEVWTEESVLVLTPNPKRVVQVVGTGQRYSNGNVKVTIPVENSILVWHVVALWSGETELKR